PKDPARARIETIHEAVCGDDQAIAVEHKRYIAAAQLIVGPHDFPGIAVQRRDIAVQTDKYKLVDQQDLVDRHNVPPQERRPISGLNADFDWLPNGCQGNSMLLILAF